MPTFGEVADSYVETHEASWRNPKHRQQWRNTLRDYAASIRDTPVDRIDTTAILSVLKPNWSTKAETAGRVRGRIETVLNAARVLGHIDTDKANPARWKGHLDHLMSKRKKLTRGNHAAMPYADLPAFMAKLGRRPARRPRRSASPSSPPPARARCGARHGTVVAPAMVAGLIPWLITHWEFRPPFLAVEATRLAGVAFIIAGVP